MTYQLTKITSIKSIAEFRSHISRLGIELDIDDELIEAEQNPLLEPVQWGRKIIGNHIAIHPMEGWDGTTSGGVSDPMIRRWERFGESGAKLIWGGEAMAVRPDGRANPNQLILNSGNAKAIGELRDKLIASHRLHWGRTDDLVIGFQLTHSGRFCRPNDKKKWEPRVAYRHPLLDAKFQVQNDSALLSDLELGGLIDDYVHAARIAHELGVDFVDIKACHGYLIHELLSAYTRPGEYGGSYENRTRFLFAIIDAVQRELPGLAIGVRISAFDSVPFEPDPTTSVGNKQGQGIPMRFGEFLPYCYAFGVDQANPLVSQLSETNRLLSDLTARGVGIVNLSAGSPYYTPHLLRPASYPPSDGYQPHEDPLISVARQLNTVKTLKETNPSLMLVGSGYSYLQEFLPLVAQNRVRTGAVDFVGLGRMVLSYPTQLIDALQGKASDRKRVCRTFSDCTTAPRNGLPSGCYPLDEYYKRTDEAQKLKTIKNSR